MDDMKFSPRQTFVPLVLLVACVAGAVLYLADERKQQHIRKQQRLKKLHPPKTWFEPEWVNGEDYTYEGYVQVEKYYMAERAGKYSGIYFIAASKDSEDRIPVYADAFERLSKLVEEKVRVTGHLRSGMTVLKLYLTDI